MVEQKSSKNNENIESFDDSESRIYNVTASIDTGHKNMLDVAWEKDIPYVMNDEFNSNTTLWILAKLPNVIKIWKSLSKETYVTL